MCFSATASFTSAALLASVSVLALSRKPERQALPYALMPLLFGIQQLLEGLIWLSFNDQADVLGCLPLGALTQGYSLFSQVFWPAFVPLAVGLLETVAWRRRAITVCGLAGLVTSMFLLSAMLQVPVTAQLQGNHIAYHFSHSHVITASLLYLVASCVSPLLSSHTRVRLFGVAAVATAALAYLIFSVWFISVWCYLAGLMSGIVLLHFFPRAQGIFKGRWHSA
jgi:hypothetical protein